MVLSVIRPLGVSKRWIQMSYEHFEIPLWCMFSSVLSLPRTEEWPVPPLPWATSPGRSVLQTALRLGAASSAKHSIGEHCSEAPIFDSEFIRLGTWVYVALIWIHLAAIKHVQVQSLWCPSTSRRAVFQKQNVGLAACLVKMQFAF